MLVPGLLMFCLVVVLLTLISWRLLLQCRDVVRSLLVLPTTAMSWAHRLYVLVVLVSIAWGLLLLLLALVQLLREWATP
jgi:hypothetical protein